MALVPSRDQGEHDLPEDHLHQACQEDQVCPAAPKNKQKIKSCNGQSLQSITGRGFSETSLAFPSCKEVSLLGKLPWLVWSLLISMGRVVPASWDAGVLVLVSHTSRHNTAARARGQTAGHEASSCCPVERAQAAHVYEDNLEDVEPPGSPDQEMPIV